MLRVVPAFAEASAGTFVSAPKEGNVRRRPFDGVSVRRFSKAKSVADRLGVCPRTIVRWANAGKITRHKINARVVLFDEAEVVALIDSARVVARPYQLTAMR